MKVKTNIYHPDTQFTHIVVADPVQCVPCNDSPCVMVCPAGVFEQAPNGVGMNVRYDRCVECAACYIACPSGNLSFDYPQAGYGIVHLYG